MSLQPRINTLYLDRSPRGRILCHGFLLTFVILHLSSMGAYAHTTVRSCELLGAGRKNRAQDVREAPLLKIREAVQRTIAGGESHRYRVMLKAGELVSVVAEQQGVDVVLGLMNPDGRLLVEVDSPNGSHGPESLSAIADKTGQYLLVVRALDKAAPSGQYYLLVKEIREGNDQDKVRIAAQAASAEGARLSVSGDAAQLREAVKNYQKALALWQSVGDQQGESASLNVIGQIYYSLGDYGQATEALKKALQVVLSTGDKRSEAELLNNLGAAYYSILDSSLKCNKRLFEEYLIRCLVTERLARTIVEPLHHSLDLSVSDL